MTERCDRCDRPLGLEDGECGRRALVGAFDNAVRNAASAEIRDMLLTEMDAECTDCARNAVDWRERWTAARHVVEAAERAVDGGMLNEDCNDVINAVTEYRRGAGKERIEDEMRDLRAEVERLRSVLQSDKPYPDDPGRTHYDGCWRDRGHHNCAVERLSAFVTEWGERFGFLAEPTHDRHSIESIDAVARLIHEKQMAANARAERLAEVLNGLIEDCRSLAADIGEPMHQPVRTIIKLRLMAIVNQAHGCDTEYTPSEEDSR